VVGACADGPLLAEVRAEGFRVIPLPFARSLNPIAHLRAFASLVRLLRAERPDIVHAHMPISAFLTRLAARIAGVPTIAFTCHGYIFKQSGSPLRRTGGFLMEWLGGKLTDIYMNVSTEEAADARRLRIHPTPVAIGNGRDPAIFRPNPQARARLRAEWGIPPETVAIVIVSRVVVFKGYRELLEAMASVPAELWVVGERLTSDRGEDLDPHFARFAETGRLRRLGSRGGRHEAGLRLRERYRAALQLRHAGLHALDAGLGLVDALSAQVNAEVDAGVHHCSRALAHATRAPPSHARTPA
jgi:glycosyltransferase involved in cell wall biosynthesis